MYEKVDLCRCTDSVGEWEAGLFDICSFSTAVAYNNSYSDVISPLTCMLTPPLNHLSNMFNGSGLR